MPRFSDRVFVIDDDKCFGCGACVALCPVNVLDLKNRVAIVNEKDCTHCKICIPSCPVFALQLVPGIPA